MRVLRVTGLNLLRRWIDWVQRFRIVIVGATLILTVLAGQYTIDNLGMDSGTKDMLSAELHWRQLDIAFEQYFPQYADNILMVVEADTPDQARDAAMLLYRSLEREQRLFTDLYYPNALPLFRESSLLFLETERLQDLADRLAAIQPFLARIAGDPTLRGLFGMLAEALEARAGGEDIDIRPLLERINTALVTLEDDPDHRLSWQQLLQDENAGQKPYRQFIQLRPVLDYSGPFPAGEAIDRVRALVAEAGIGDIGAEVRLTGDAVLAHEEMLSVTRGIGLAAGLALVAVTIIMLIGLGSVPLVFATLVTLLSGLIFTAAFAALAIGNLNIISVAFAVLYIGLGVDFAIHYCLRYRELLARGESRHDAIDDASLTIGRSLFLCAMTTAMGFFAFIPTDFDGVAELGLISGVGTFISLLVTMTLLPALLSLLPAATPSAQRAAGLPLPEGLGALPLSHSGKVRLVTAVLALLGLFLSTQVRFDYNTLNLQNPRAPSVITFKSLLSSPDTSPWHGIVVASGRQDARQTIDTLQPLDVVEGVFWIEDFIPPGQEEKLAIIDKMNLFLYGLPAPAEAGTGISAAEQYAAVQNFAERLDLYLADNDDPDAARLFNNLNEYLESIVGISVQERAASLGRLSGSLLDSLPGRLQSLRESLDAGPVTQQTLPPILSSRWHSDLGGYLLEIFPAENLNDNEATRRFVRRIQERDMRVIGAPVIKLEAGEDVVRAFRTAFLSAFAVITLFLLLVLERKSDAIYILIPLLLAAVFTTASTVIMNMPFNFANIIALPLLLGIGVDSGIHILHRYRIAPPVNNNILGTSSARAVVVSALTTMISIGNLAFSHHTGTASMGKLLSIGIAITLVCMLIVLPSLLQKTGNAGNGK